MLAAQITFLTDTEREGGGALKTVQEFAGEASHRATRRPCLRGSASVWAAGLLCWLGKVCCGQPRVGFGLANT